MRATAQFRAAVMRPGAALFVFMFSRNTLPPNERPVAGAAFVFSQFKGEPSVFLTADQLVSELAVVGFRPDPLVPLTEHDRPPEGTSLLRRAPVTWEGPFRPGLEA